MDKEMIPREVLKYPYMVTGDNSQLHPVIPNLLLEYTLNSLIINGYSLVLAPLRQ